MDETPKAEELLRLLAELTEGDWDEPRAARLRELLVDDPRAQDLYLNAMRIHAELHFDYDPGAEPMGLPGSAAMPIPPPTSRPDPGGKGLPPSRRREDRERSRRRPPAWAIVLGVGASLAAVLLLLASGGLRGPAGGRRGSGEARGRVPDTPKDALALVAGLRDVRWDPAGGAAPSEGDVLRPGRLGIRSGRVVLVLLGGVMLAAEGPADLDLISPGRVSCRRGRLRAWVPEGAEGFTVSTPGGDVVDRGTEFGLNVDPDGRSHVLVFEGKAEVVAGAGPGKGKDKGKRERRQAVEQSQAFEFGPGEGPIEKAVARPEDFPVSPRTAALPLALEPAYPGAVLASRPRGYWRFESMARGLVPNEVSGGPPLRVHGPISLVGPAGGNRSAEFGADDVDKFFLMDGTWSPDVRAGYAIELWVDPRRFHHASLANLIAAPTLETPTPHLVLIELTAIERPTSYSPARLRQLHRWPPAARGGENLYSNAHYTPFRWHHVVGQVADGRMELYLDGALTRSQPLPPGDVPTPCRLLLGRLRPARETLASDRRPLVGRLDEVAVYDHALTAAEVRHHLELAHPTVPPR